MFDETDFPFSALHTNTGAHLRSKISLLPLHLLNPSSNGTEHIDDSLFNSPNPTNFSGENYEEIMQNIKIQQD